MALITKKFMRSLDDLVMVIAIAMSTTPLRLLRLVSGLIYKEIGVDIRRWTHLPFAGPILNVGQLLNTAATKFTRVFIVGYNRDVKPVWWEATDHRMIMDELLYWSSRDPYFIVVATNDPNRGSAHDWSILIWDLRSYSVDELKMLCADYQDKMVEDLKTAATNMSTGRYVPTQNTAQTLLQVPAQHQLTKQSGSVAA